VEQGLFERSKSQSLVRAPTWRDRGACDVVARCGRNVGRRSGTRRHCPRGRQSQESKRVAACMPSRRQRRCLCGRFPSLGRTNRSQYPYAYQNWFMSNEGFEGFSPFLLLGPQKSVKHCSWTNVPLSPAR
jgi:hypothetical protein